MEDRPKRTVKCFGGYMKLTQELLILENKIFLNRILQLHAINKKLVKNQTQNDQ